MSNVTFRRYGIVPIFSISYKSFFFSGHAFSRAVRAHILSLAALVCVLVYEADALSEDRKRNLSALYEHLLTAENNPVASFTDDIDIDDDLTSFRDLVETLLINAEQEAGRVNYGCSTYAKFSYF